MSEKKDKRTYLDYPFVGIGVVIWKDNKFLLIQRGKPPRMGQWSIPGGRQELGETVKETALRETLEETGLTVELTDFLDVVDSIQKDEKGNIAFHATLVDYAAEWLSGEASANSDAIDVAWHNLEDLKELGLWSETTRIIQKSARLRAKRQGKKL
ncbi:MAG: NUDIX hydrolase [Rhodospirillales bacterium]|jgi:8-oxo-dGTP diphosphatase